MNYRLDTNDAFHDDPFYDQRDEARTEEGRTDPARPGSLRDAIEHGYDPRDEFEDVTWMTH